MVNYGNSKALVQVNERRPHNPDGPVKSAWGQTGTMLEGQPLAIEYNANVLEDRPAMPEMISEEHITHETLNETQNVESHKQTEQAASRKPDPRNQPPQMQQQDGFFITANDGPEMQGQDKEEEQEQQEEEAETNEQEWEEGEAQDPSLDEFGKWKMDKFKAFARAVLVQPAGGKGAAQARNPNRTGPEGTSQMTSDNVLQNTDLYPQPDGGEETNRVTNSVYNGNDIVQAYKELKKCMAKSQGSKTMPTTQNEKPKGYLKTTIAM